jgi:hypothetical protein
MTSLQYTHKNNKRFTSTTRKNNKTNLKTSSHLHSLDHTYSERFIRQEFIRRMSEPIHFTIYNPTSNELKKLNTLTGPILTDDEKWELYINGK